MLGQGPLEGADGRQGVDDVRPVGLPVVLRTLVSQVIVRNATTEVVELEIVWTGGLRQALRILLPRGVQKLVVERAGREGSVPTTAASRRRPVVTLASVRRLISCGAASPLSLKERLDPVEAIGGSPGRGML